VNNELERVRKEADVAKFEAVPWNLARETEERTRNFRIAGCPAEIRISHLNTSEGASHPSHCHSNHTAQFVSTVEPQYNIPRFNVFQLVTFSFNDS
jgi:hypothetical protein